MTDAQIIVPLTALDRCDACAAQARVRVRRAALDLVLCGHHFNRHELALMAGGWLVNHDARAELLKRHTDIKDTA